MSHRQRLDRLEHRWGARCCPICARPAGGLMRFVLAEEGAEPSDPVAPCPRCHQPIIFALDLGSAVEDER